MNASFGSPDDCHGREDHVTDASLMLSTPVDSIYIFEVAVLGVSFKESYCLVPCENVGEAHLDCESNLHETNYTTLMYPNDACSKNPTESCYRDLSLTECVECSMETALLSPHAFEYCECSESHPEGTSEEEAPEVKVNT